MEQNLINKLYSWLLKATKVVTAALLAIMVVIVFANVVARYYLSASLAWSEELARFMLIWLVFLGAILAYVDNEHLGLDLLVKKMPRKLELVVACCTDLLVLYALWLVLWGGYLMTVDSWEWEAPATDIPFGYTYLVIPVSGAVMMFQTLLKLYGHARDLLAKEVKPC
ncbi:MAG: TRAP transporter small permease [Negativicutes bacterium]|nr:TRAP transporter small permease [Negativicutes bacterium]